MFSNDGGCTYTNYESQAINKIKEFDTDAEQ